MAKKRIIDILNDEDYLEIATACRQLAIKAERGGYQNNLLKSISWSLRNRLRDMNEGFLPTSNYLVAAVRSIDGMRPIFEEIDRIREDRFYALRLIKGDDFTDKFLGIVKNLYKNALAGGITRYASGGDYLYAARKALDEKVSSVCGDEVRGILFPEYRGRSAASLGVTLEKYYFSKEEFTSFSHLKLPTSSPHLKTSFSVDGKIVAKPLRMGQISQKPTSGFASAVTAAETGSSAQAKNPRPRAGNSGDKNMSRDGGPA